jgi:hypothetical protein
VYFRDKHQHRKCDKTALHDNITLREMVLYPFVACIYERVVPPVAGISLLIVSQSAVGMGMLLSFITAITASAGVIATSF